LFFPIYQTYLATDGKLHLNPSAADWIYIAILAVVCTVYAWVVAINLTKKLSVFFIQLTLNLEPVYGILLALLVFGQQEVMSIYFYAGTLVIIGAVVAYPYLKKRLNSTFPREAER
jgi:drug/metabolite transporter (DMT)-like permease